MNLHQRGKKLSKVVTGSIGLVAVVAASLLGLHEWADIVATKSANATSSVSDGASSSGSSSSSSGSSGSDDSSSDDSSSDTSSSDSSSSTPSAPVSPSTDGGSDATSSGS